METNNNNNNEGNKTMANQFTNKPRLLVEQNESSSSSKVYETVAYADDFTTSCNCPGWIYKRPNQPRGCRHTHALEAKMDAIAARAAA